MLQRTEPEGVIYAHAYYDNKDAPINHIRVLYPEGERDVLVPLPPPGTHQPGEAVREAPAIREAPPRITRENVGRIRPGMASADVRSVLGDGRVVRSGECVERSGGSWTRRTTAILDWQAGSRRVTITFENDRVLQVQQQGLE